MFRLLTVCIAFFGLGVVLPSSVNPSDLIPLRKSPVELLDDRAPAGKPFIFTITIPKEMGSTDFQFQVRFKAGENDIAAQAHVQGEEEKSDEVIYTIQAMVPGYKELFNGVASTWSEPWWSARRAQLEVRVDEYSPSYEALFAVPHRGWATFWGVFALLGLLLVSALMKPILFPKDRRFGGGDGDEREAMWKERKPIQRLLLYPLEFAVTPIGSYSISISQILYWTGIVIFGSIYVFLVRGGFLNVNAQVLTLLGISGGTALAAKANAVVRSRNIPEEFFKGLTRTRIPKLRDLICTGGSPNIFKFQIFAFTIINGILVLKQLYTGFNFPVIPEEQLVLMGISSAVYLGNEITSGNIWETIEKKVQQAREAKKNGDNTTYKALSKEVKDLLASIYSAD
jgi:hypothetical protein